MHVSGTPGQAALFAAGVVLTGVSLVFDQATIGLMRGGLQLTRNAIFAAAKLLALPAAAIVLHDQFGVGITASWVAGIALSMVLLAIRLRFAGIPVLPRPDWGVLRGLGRTALAHNWLNLSLSIPMSLIPVLVTVIVSPSANAAFYAAWTLSRFPESRADTPVDGSLCGGSSRPSGNCPEAALHLAVVAPNRATRHGRAWLRCSPGTKLVRPRLRPRGHVAPSGCWSSVTCLRSRRCSTSRSAARPVGYHALPQS